MFADFFPVKLLLGIAVNADKDALARLQVHNFLLSCVRLAHAGWQIPLTSYRQARYAELGLMARHEVVLTKRPLLLASISVKMANYRLHNDLGQVTRQSQV